MNQQAPAKPGPRVVDKRDERRLCLEGATGVDEHQRVSTLPRPHLERTAARPKVNKLLPDDGRDRQRKGVTKGASPGSPLHHAERGSDHIDAAGVDQVSAKTKGMGKGGVLDGEFEELRGALERPALEQNPDA